MSNAETPVSTGEDSSENRPDAPTSSLDYSAEALIRRKRSTWPEASNIDADLVVRLFRLRDLIHHESRKAVKEKFGLTPAEFEVIVTLRTIPPPYAITPTELRQSMLITPGGLTKVMNNLADRGLVERRPSKADRRSWLLQLTGSGIAMAETALPHALDVYARQIGAGLSRSDITVLSRLLEKALQALEGPVRGVRAAS